MKFCLCLLCLIGVESASHTQEFIQVVILKIIEVNRKLYNTSDKRINKSKNTIPAVKLAHITGMIKKSVPPVWYA